MSRLVTVALLGIGTAAAVAPPATAQAGPTAAEWREDLRFLSARLPVVHPNLFHHISKPEFEAAVARLDARIPNLEPHQILVELARLTALVGESHTGVLVSRQPRELLATLHGFPIRFHSFEDGLFVTAVDTAWAGAAGLRVVRIGAVAASEALRRVGAIIPADNPQWVRRHGPSHLAVAEVLHALEITPSRAELTLVLADGAGAERSVTLSARPLPELSDYLNPLAEPPPRPNVAFARRSEPAPLWLRDQRNRYWLTYLPETRSLYLQINVMLDKPEESLEQFFARALALADSLGPERFIIDIRQNNGGNNVALPLVHGLIRRPALNREGTLFVVIGFGTVSAGQHLATMLDLHTNAVFVGEPTASRPNHYGVVGAFSLPRSRVFVWYSRLLVQDSDPGDYRPWQPPDIAAALTSADYLRGGDPALEAILAFRPLPPLADSLDAAYSRGGLAAMREAYRAMATRYRETGRSTERDLNRMGYMLLGRGKRKDAIAVFELNVQEHPSSFNVYDSVGDAYLRSGNRAAGLASYRRSVELNPGNEHAKRVLAAAVLDR